MGKVKKDNKETSKSWKKDLNTILIACCLLSGIVTLHICISILRSDKSGIGFTPSSHGWALVEFFIIQLPVSLIGLLCGMFGAESSGARRPGLLSLLIMCAISGFMVTLMFRWR